MCIRYAIPFQCLPCADVVVSMLWHNMLAKYVLYRALYLLSIVLSPSGLLRSLVLMVQAFNSHCYYYWCRTLTAESALNQLNFEIAERCYVKCEQYPSIQFVKKISKLDVRFSSFVYDWSLVDIVKPSSIFSCWSVLQGQCIWFIKERACFTCRCVYLWPF